MPIEFGQKGLKIDFGGIMLSEYDSTTDSKGDIYYRNRTVVAGSQVTPEMSKLAIGTSQEVLRVSSAGIIEWAKPEKDIDLEPIDNDAAVVAGVGLKPFVVPVSMNGMDLVDAIAAVYDKGVTGTTDVMIKRIREAAAIGDSTTQFDITNPSANLHTYTFDGTGTDPLIADTKASLKVGDQIEINAQNFNAGNKGTFVLTAVGADYFQVDNAAGVVEANKTIGTGSIVPIKHRDMLSTAITIGDEYYARDGVIDTDYDDIATGDQILRDVDAIHSGTAPNGLGTTITLRDP